MAFFLSSKPYIHKEPGCLENYRNQEKMISFTSHLFPSPLELGSRPSVQEGLRGSELSWHREEQPRWPSELPLTAQWVLPLCCLPSGAAASLEPWPWTAAGRGLVNTALISLMLSFSLITSGCYQHYCHPKSQTQHHTSY